MRHNVAPMAGRVANAQENGFILSARFFQRRLHVPPGVPINRVVRMLQKIRGCNVLKLLGMYFLTFGERVTY